MYFYFFLKHDLIKNCNKNSIFKLIHEVKEEKFESQIEEYFPNGNKELKQLNDGEITYLFKWENGNSVFVGNPNSYKLRSYRDRSTTKRAKKLSLFF